MNFDYPDLSKAPAGGRGRLIVLPGLRSTDMSPMFDLSDLSGKADPVPLGQLLWDNRECPPDESEVEALRACPVAGTVHLGIGGGFVTVRRVA